MSLTQSTSNEKSVKTDIAINTKQKLKEDTLAFAQLLYDIFKERQLNASVDHDQNTKSYKIEEEQS